MLFERLIGN